MRTSFSKAVDSFRDMVRQPACCSKKWDLTLAKKNTQGQVGVVGHTDPRWQQAITIVRLQNFPVYGVPAATACTRMEV